MLQWYHFPVANYCQLYCVSVIKVGPINDVEFPLHLDRYKNYDFGRCPRVYCSGQPCLPVGQSDIARSSTVEIFCPSVLYFPIFLESVLDIDGAYIGTTFPHLVLMTYGQLKPRKPSQNYVPRVFGYKLHKQRS
ncbi:unnamed protein product [Lupinus luteus]|uniref:Casein kinase II subunit beta n=1 Tax=Lupinus luteus TaxID=3873 RepID=A0AAV1WQM9_LUPLU